MRSTATRHKQAPVCCCAIAPSRPIAGPGHNAGTTRLPNCSALQADYAAWFEALPESLRGTATADALQAIVELDLDVWQRSRRRAVTAGTERGSPSDPRLTMMLR